MNQPLSFPSLQPQLPFEQLWGTIALIPKLPSEFRINLHLNDYCFEGLTTNLLESLRTESHYDPDLIAMLFSERDIFWQPSIAPSPKVWHTRFQVFHAFLRDYIAALNARDQAADYLCAAILHDLQNKVAQAQQDLLNQEKKSTYCQFQALIRFRLSTYAHILFFLQHPLVPPPTLRLAYHRLDLMVRGILLKSKVPMSALHRPYCSLHAKIADKPRSEQSIASKQPSSVAPPKPKKSEI